MIVPKFKYIFDVLGIAVLMFGVSASGRQIYLQNMPSDQLAGGYCDITVCNFYLTCILFLMHLGKVFQGSSKCAEESWVFLYLNIPEWATFIFCFNDNTIIDKILSNKF